MWSCWRKGEQRGILYSSKVALLGKSEDRGAVRENETVVEKRELEATERGAAKRIHHKSV